MMTTNSDAKNHVLYAERCVRCDCGSLRFSNFVGSVSTPILMYAISRVVRYANIRWGDISIYFVKLVILLANSKSNTNKSTTDFIENKRKSTMI